MKDKPQNKITMSDMVHEHAKKTPKIITDESQLSFDEKGVIKHNIQNSNADLKYEQDMKGYNSNIRNIDEMYSNLEPVSKVIVRCFVNEPTRTPGGIIMKYTHKISIPTQSGVGDIGEVESPYPYSRLAVVVSVPKGYEGFKRGDLVMLGDEPVIAKPVGKGKGATIGVPYGFAHYEWKGQFMPTDVTNRHYGYLLIPTHMIDCKVNDYGNME